MKSDEKPPRIFLAYSSEDLPWKDRLTAHLSVLSRQGQLELWDEQRVAAGANRTEEIKRAIDSAAVVVLLISATFLASDFIQNEQIPRILRRALAQGTRIVPVLVKPCAWQKVHWLSPLQMRPDNHRALSAGTDHQVDTDLSAVAMDMGEFLGSPPKDAAARAEARSEPAVSPSVPLLSSVLRAAFQNIVDRTEQGHSMVGTPYGFKAIDLRLGGILPGTFIAILGDAAAGKTSFALNVAVNVASPIQLKPLNSNPAAESGAYAPGLGVAVFCMGMQAQDVALRMVCAEARVSLRRLLLARMYADDWRRLTEAGSFLAGIPLSLDTSTSLSMGELEERVRGIQRILRDVGHSKSPWIDCGRWSSRAGAVGSASWCDIDRINR